ncbi:MULTISPECIES: hypothetical protein [unclassified Halomonas]|uniref:hypothetical protein n=1 Tax=unclassified Halomonas TaxID=2609666 RepID=UPI0020767536|nr:MULTISPECIES: hypothetical protein [unclassified Halomonas]
MRRLLKSYRIPLWVVALMLVATTVMATGWAAAHQRRLEHRDFYLMRIQQQQEAIAEAQRVSVGLMAANAIIIGAWQHEKTRADDNEQSMHAANGRLGPLRRQVNALESDVERLRNNWTSEIGVER